MGKAAISLDDGTTIDTDNAWVVTRDGADALVTYSATDRTGRSGITFDMPAIFVTDRHAYTTQDEVGGVTTPLGNLVTFFAEAPDSRIRPATTMVDPFQGRADVRNRLIRVVRPEALDDDPLRLLRAVRLAATLGFSIEDATAEHIRRRSKAIVKPASERVRDELFLILSERDAERHLLLLDSLGLLTPLLPELEPLRGFAPGMYRDHDVLTHAIKTVGYVDNVLDDLPAFSPDHAAAVSDHLNGQIEHGVTRKAALRFACLVHDMAKPDTLTESDGHVRFHGHDNLGADKAVFLCRRLRLSRNTEALVTKTIKYHMRLFNLSGTGGPSRNAMYRYCRDLGDALPESLILSQADARATYEIMPKEKFSDTEKPMAQVLDYYYTKFLKARARPLVTGDDLIKMGFTPGPRFREILEEVKEKQAEGGIKDRQEALDYIEGLSDADNQK